MHVSVKTIYQTFINIVFPIVKYLVTQRPSGSGTHYWGVYLLKLYQLKTIATLTMSDLYQLSALQIDESIEVHPGVNVSGSRDMHHGSGKVAHGLV